jgi:putative NADH-flavin reductase
MTIDGAEAVISTLGGGPLANPGMVLSDGMRAIVGAMKQTGLSRVLAVAGSGVLTNGHGRLRSESPDFPEIFAAINREHLGTWEALKSSQLDWTLVCCPDLLDGELTRRYRVTADLLPEGGSSISVEDTAAFLLQQVPLTPFVRRRVGIAY